jgi:sugar phosphate permease
MADAGALAQQPQARKERDRWIALVVLCAGFLMIILDQTVVNVALPSIQDDLGFSQASLAWVVNAYLIAFGGLLLLAGRLGVVPKHVVHPGLSGGWGCRSHQLQRRAPDEVAR